MHCRAFASIVLLASSGAFAADSSPSLQFSGRIYSDVYAPTTDPSTTPFPYAGTSLWLQGDARFNDATSARAILEADGIESSSSGIGGPGYGGGSIGALHTGLREGWVDYAHAGWDVRMGRQIIPWGKADAINPTDFLSAKDFTIFNPDDEVRRIGANSIEATMSPLKGSSPFTFTLVWTPVAPESRIILPPSVVPSSITLEPTPATPAETLSNSELAFKTGYQGQGWDASLLAFRGYNHLPELAVASSAPAPTITPVFHTLRAVGGDFSVAAGAWTFRGESAYAWTPNDDGSDPSIEPTHWDSVVGVERPIGNIFRVQTQLYWRYFPNYVSPGSVTGPDPLSTEVAQGVAKANALLLNFQNQVRTSGTLRFAYSEDAVPWEAELFTVADFVGGDYLVRPKLSYAWSDALKSSLGVEYYGGPDDQPLGALHGYSSVFVEAKYLF